MGAWKNCVLQENLHAHKIPRKGGILSFLFLGGGGESADFIFMGAGMSLKFCNIENNLDGGDCALVIGFF